MLWLQADVEPGVYGDAVHRECLLSGWRESGSQRETVHGAVDGEAQGSNCLVIWLLLKSFWRQVDEAFDSYVQK